MAVGLLQQLRELTGQAIPLAWQSKLEHPLAAIEVYPAGTLRAHGLPDAGYKEADRVEARGRIISGLREHLELPADTSMLLGDADVLDAAVCVLAAQDFLSVPVIQPESPQEARKEGWIWVRCSR